MTSTDDEKHELHINSTPTTSKQYCHYSFFIIYYNF